MLPGFDALVEERILKAQKNGDLDNLPGQGKPLNLDDMAIPEDFRMAYRVLKNSGFVPPEVEIRNEIKKLEELLQSMDDNKHQEDGEKQPHGRTLSEAEIKRRSEVRKKLDFLMLKLNNSRGNSTYSAAFPSQYRQKLLKRMS
ncbi:MAG: DUF1992 domain-containing protein [Desulfamplus sp.]|nr:DUF1992 domain-containing protein [Desulfamplus sp.]MBF0257485.1 DUF1992 domain-containing protein [Desulfamplus sp.]